MLSNLQMPIRAGTVPDKMYFAVDEKTYTMMITPRPLFRFGQPAMGAIDLRSRVILLTDQLPRQRRLEILIHEYRHAWRESRGHACDDPPADRPYQDEADCQDAAEFATTFIRQLAEQGGEAALHMMMPTRDIRIGAQPTGPLARTRAECGYCSSPVMVGSIKTARPLWSEELGIWTVARGFPCTSCDCVTTWTEASTVDGMPAGSIVPFPSPQVLSGARATAWTTSHTHEEVFHD